MPVNQVDLEAALLRPCTVFDIGNGHRRCSRCANGEEDREEAAAELARLMAEPPGPFSSVRSTPADAARYPLGA